MRELVTTYSAVQLITTVYLLATLIAQLILGNAADHYGRRPVMLVSLSVFAMGSVLCAAATSIEFLLAARFVQGFGASVCMLLPRTIIRDVYPRDRAASKIGYMTTAMMVAPLFGPFLGGWVSENTSWRWMYGGLGVAAFAAVVLCYLFLHETIEAKGGEYERTSFLSAAKVLFSERVFVGVCLMLAGSIGIYYIFIGGGPFMGMESRGMSATHYGQWFGIVGVGYLSGNFFAGKFSTRFGSVVMGRYGQLPMALGVLLFWVLSSIQHPVALFFPMFLVAFSNGMTLPNLMSIAMGVRPSLSASASGLVGFVQLGFGVLMTVLLSWLLPMSTHWFYIVITLAGLVCGAGIIIVLSNERG